MSYLTKIDQKLAGTPDTTLTILLIITGIIAWIVALFGTPSLKVAVFAWMAAP